MKILMLTHRLPYAPNRGDRIRAYHLLCFLQEHADVHLLSLVHDEEEERHRNDCLATSVRTIRATSSVLTGMPECAQSACIRADSAPEIASAILDLLRHTPEQRRLLSDRAALDSVGWDRQLAPVLPLLQNIRYRDMDVVA